MKLPVSAVQAIKTSVGLLVNGEYDTLWHMTGKVGTVAGIEHAVAQYGRTLTHPPDTVWEDIPNVLRDPGVNVYNVDFPLWTVDEGESDLVLCLTLTEAMHGVYDIKFRGVRVP